MTLRLCIVCGENVAANAEGECLTCRPPRTEYPMPDDPMPFLPEDEDDEPPMRDEFPTYTPERPVQFADQDDLGRGIWGRGLK